MLYFESENELKFYNLEAWCVDDKKCFKLLIRPWSQRSRSHIVKIYNTACNLSSVFIYITEGVQIWHNDFLTTYSYVSDHRYAIGVKEQGQILWLVTQTFLSFSY